MAESWDSVKMFYLAKGKVVAELSDERWLWDSFAM
jgi:hypothetical protein